MTDTIDTMKSFIATAEMREAYDIAHGTVHVYGPDDTHDETNVWDDAKGEMPFGMWLSQCGNYRTDFYANETFSGQNFFYCQFCKSLRAAALEPRSTTT